MTFKEFEERRRREEVARGGTEGSRGKGRIMNGRMIENHGGCCARDENETTEMRCLA